ncbi:MAG: hypothetical protein MUO63_08175 [Desulfobulbaceae bacterium]|nr:hypothetical protein [Desulfobulbaceae bacterium]
MGSDLVKCYLCDENAVGNEHVPPRCIFPKSKDLEPGIDLRRELLTVPSCNLHNSEKSGEDVYFLNVITSLDGINEIGREHYRRQIRRQNSRNPSIIYRFAERAIEINSNLAHEVEIERLDVFIAHLAHALYLAHFGDKWHGEVSWMPEFLSRLPNRDEEQKRITMIRGIDSEFDGIAYHGANQGVFMYQVIEGDGLTKMRLHFYDGCKILLVFSAS